MGKVPATVINGFNAISSVIKRRKVLSAGIAAVIVLLAGFIIFRGAGSASGEYQVDTAQKGDITSTITASGKVEPVDTISLSFKNSEIIKAIHVRAGDHVTVGQPLAEQENENLKAQLIQAGASLKSAQAKYDLLVSGPRQEELAKAGADVKMARVSYDIAKENLERYKELQGVGAISQSDFDKANMDFVNAEGKLTQSEESLKLLQAGNRTEDIASAGASVESSRAQLLMSQKDFEGAVMTSPIDGIVSAVSGAVGQRATANNNNTSGGGFITIISEALQVRAQVNEADIGRTALGQKVEFTVNSFPDKKFKGKVISISPQAYTESNVQIYDVIIQTDEKYSELKAGMPADVNIIVDRHEKVVAIPKGAVNYAVTYMNKMKLTAGGGDGSTPAGGGRDKNKNAGNELNPGEQSAFVLVLDGSGNPVPRRVALGLSDMRSYEVVKGLEEGEKVVLGSSGTPSASSQGNVPFMGAPRGGSNVRR